MKYFRIYVLLEYVRAFAIHAIRLGRSYMFSATFNGVRSAWSECRSFWNIFFSKKAPNHVKFGSHDFVQISIRGANRLRNYRLYFRIHMLAAATVMEEL